MTIYEKEVAEFVSEEGESFFVFAFFFRSREQKKRSKFSLVETPATRSSESRHKLNVTN